MADNSDLISGLIIGIIVAVIGAVLAIVLPRYVFKKRVSDKELFEYWRNNVFDRRSFQGRMKGETHNFRGKYLAEFHRGIEDTITCIKTGICRRGESGVMKKYEGHGYSTIRKKEWRENMKTVVEKLNIIDVKLKDMESSPAIQGDDPTWTSY
jgi:uncharacterized protein YnzC (UPF0291/DUF896 family)